MKQKVRDQLKEYQDIRYALDSSTILAITDRNGIILEVNDKFCEITQFRREEVIGKTHRLFNSGYHSRAFFIEMWSTIQNGEIWSGELRNQKKDGTFYWVHSTIVPIKNKFTDEVEKFIALRIEISKGKQAEEQLRNLMKRDYERTIKNLDNMVFKLKLTRSGVPVITLVEGKLSRILGVNEGALNLNKIEGFFGENYQQILLKFMAAFKGVQQSFKHEYKGRYLYTTLSPILELGEVIEVIGNTNDITMLELAQNEIHYMAYHDDLTDLPNRRQLSIDLGELLTKKVENKYGIMFIDIDRFKQINDTLGFQIGDQLVIDLSKRLTKLYENKGTVYRLAGDEFVLITSIKNEAEFSTQIEEVLERIEYPFLINEQELLITCSIGVSTFPHHHDTAEKILNRVDTALRHCKSHGKQGYVYYTLEMDRDIKGRLEQEIELRKAIKNQELLLYYQPKYCMKTKEMIGMEALVRWNSPTKGFINPGSFIPLAEETGLIVQIGEWVLFEACLQNQKWINSGFDPLRIAVNVSTIELLRPDFIGRVKNVLNETGLDPKLLELEITENSVMENMERGIQILHELKSLGIYISVDDFGTGYSSLGYLKKFPINALKIDQGFIRGMDQNESDEGIVKAIIQLAHNFQLKVVGEGVETEAILQILHELGCDEVQGFYFSRPLPPTKFEKLRIK